MADSALAIAVVDLGFGDAGKGLVTDYLTRALGVTAIVRFNGGAQAGHNVVTPDGRHHTFAQLAAGSFVPGVETWLGPSVVVHPSALLVEAEHLARSGVPDVLSRVRLHADAPLITPVHQALGRLRELARGELRHGSCGVGVGAVMEDVRRGSCVLRARDLAEPARLRAGCARLVETHGPALRDLLPQIRDPNRAQRELIAFEPSALERWSAVVHSLTERVRIVEDDAWNHALRGHRRLVFEWAQGVLLDREHGFYPYTSPTDCTFEPAECLLRTCDPDRELLRLGVLRSYVVRHGPGPLPGEIAPAPPWSREAHNADNPWQGRVRASWPDWLLYRYALACCAGVDSLFVTHLDRVEPAWSQVDAYEIFGERLESLPSMAELSLAERAQFAAQLMDARPVSSDLQLSSTDPGLDLAAQLAAGLELKLAYTSTGPTWRDVQSLLPLA